MFVIVGVTGGGAILLVVTAVILCALIVRKCRRATDEPVGKLYRSIIGRDIIMLIISEHFTAD